MSKEEKAENPWAAEQSKRNKIDVNDLKFDDDSTSNVRIMPGKDGAKPFYKYIIHWIPQNGSNKGRPIIHPQNERCIVCDYIAELWDEIHRLKEEENLTDKSPEVKSLLEKISGVKAGKKCDMNVIDRDNQYTKDDKGKKKILIKRMTTVKTLYDAIFALGASERWGDPSDIKKGYDLEIIVKGAGLRREYSAVGSREIVPLTDEEKDAIDNCYDLKALRKTTSMEDITDILDNAKSPYHNILKLNKKKKNDDDDNDNDEKEERKSKSDEEEESNTKKRKNDDDNDEENDTRKSRKRDEDEEKEVKKSKKDDDDNEEERKPRKDEDDDEDDRKETKKRKDEDDDDDDVKEQKKSRKDEDEDDDKDLKKNEKEEKKDDDEDNSENLDDYECKGDFDEDDSNCKTCKAKDDCEEFQPIYKKAKKIGVDVSATRSSDEIRADYKKKKNENQQEEEKPTSKKKIPF